MTEQRAVRGWARLLGRINWSAFVTLTFRQTPTPWAARAAAEAWIKRMEREVVSNVPYVVVVESSPRLHVHALIAGIGDRFAEQRIRPHWRSGFVHVHQPRTSRAVAYVARKLADEQNEFLLPPNLGTRAKRLRWREGQIRRRAQ